jgi:hypothetical protein
MRSFLFDDGKSFHDVDKGNFLFLICKGWPICCGLRRGSVVALFVVQDTPSSSEILSKSLCNLRHIFWFVNN